MVLILPIRAFIYPKCLLNQFTPFVIVLQKAVSIAACIKPLA